jgi:hypothetical protein
MVIRENWSSASDWPEIRELENLLPKDPLAMEELLPEAARNSVRQLLKKLPIEPGTNAPHPGGGAIKPCRELSTWSGFEPDK